MSNISVMLGCCLRDDEMEIFMKKYPEYFEINLVKSDRFSKSEETEFIENDDQYSQESF